MSKLRLSLSIVLATVGLLVVGVTAEAAVVATYDAALGNGNPPQQRPTTQGWLQGASDSPYSVFVPASGGDPDYWKLNETGGSGFYRLTSTGTTGYTSAMDGADGWTATLTARLVAAARDNKAKFAVGDGINLFEINLWDGLDFGDLDPGAFYNDGVAGVGSWPRLGPAPPAVGSINPLDGFHTYQIVMDAGGTGTATSTADDLISIYIDGVLLVGPSARTAFPTSGENEFDFGHVQGGGDDSEAHYSFAQLETGQNPLVPEPSTLVLLGLASLSLLGSRRQQ